MTKPKALKGVKPIDNGIIVLCDVAQDELAAPGSVIIKPETSQKLKTPYGWVVAVGPGRYDPLTCKRLPMQVNLLDRVLVKINCGYVFKYKEVEYMCVHEHEIVLVEG